MRNMRNGSTVFDTVLESDFFYHGVLDCLNALEDLPGMLEIAQMPIYQQQKCYVAYNAGWDFQDNMHFGTMEIETQWMLSRHVEERNKNAG